MDKNDLKQTVLLQNLRAMTFLTNKSLQITFKLEHRSSSKHDIYKTTL